MGLLAALGLLASTFGCGRAGAPEPASAFVAARDGVRLAVDVYVPAPPGVEDGDAGALARWPSVLRITRRWRELAMARRPGLGAPRAFEAATFNAAGYALVVVDARGTGASFGARAAPLVPGDVADAAAVLDWIVAQPWSDGRVAVWGDGDDAGFAELAAASRHPSVRAAVLRFADHDRFAQLTHPGGVPNRRLLYGLAREATLLDGGDPCAFAPDDQACDEVARVFSGPRPVGGEDAALSAAITGHDARAGAAAWFSAAAGAASRDEPLLAGAAREAPIDGASPHRLGAALLDGGVAIQSWAGWLDGGSAEAALARWAARPTRHEVWLTTLGHRGVEAADPLGALKGPPAPPVAEQFAAIVAFLDRHVKAMPSAGDQHAADAPIRAAVTGAAGEDAHGRTAWLSLGGWPPPTASVQRWHLASSGELLASPPGHRGRVERPLAAEPSGGAAGRWLGRLGEPVDYAGPSPEDEASAAFTSAPLDAPITIVGHPLVTVTVAIDRPDGVVHAYLELVAAGGHARLLTDGGLALPHRALAAPTLASDPFPLAHPFTLAERRATAPGEPVALAFRMWPIAARVPAGHRLRLSLVGGTMNASDSAGPGAPSTSANMALLLGPGAQITVPVLAYRREPRPALTARP